VASEQAQNILSAMPWDVLAASGFHQAEPAARQTVIACLTPHMPARRDMANKVLISQCFCGDRSADIYSD